MSEPHPSPPFAVTLYCRAEKARTEEVFARVVAFSAAGSWTSARREFKRLSRRLQRHIRLAEDAFFPLFEVKTGGATGLTRELVDDHRAIARDLGQLEVCLRDRRLDDLAECVRTLRDRMAEHDGRELRLLCPLIDRLLSDAERQFLGSRVLTAGKPGARRPPGRSAVLGPQATRLPSRREVSRGEK
ncbi:MAG TPA: hemerythrin domain-containing protein [Vicinamibacteria bacterium]